MDTSEQGIIDVLRLKYVNTFFSTSNIGREFPVQIYKTKANGRRLQIQTYSQRLKTLLQSRNQIEDINLIFLFYKDESNNMIDVYYICNNELNDLPGLMLGKEKLLVEKRYFSKNAVIDGFLKGNNNCLGVGEIQSPIQISLAIPVMH